MDAKVFLDRRGVWAFALGCTAVTIGVLMHIPMFLIVAGIGVAAYGLLPRKVGDQMEAASRISVHAPEDAPLSPAHWGLMVVLTIALVIDVMKPAACCP